jgi:dihydroorotase-like cyclic amidohydrolase
MPSTRPPVVSAAALRAKAELVAPSAWVDFALWAGGTDVAQFEAMARAGAAGLKVYMVTSPGFERLYTPDDATLRRVLAAAAALGWTVAVHAGDHAAMERERAALRAAGRRDARAVIELQYGQASIDGLRRVLRAAADLGVRLHVAHLSVFGTRALDEVLAHRARGFAATAETCVPALGLDDLDRLGVYALPTAFDDATRERYWTALAAGEVDAIATDHAPHTRADKEPGTHDAFAAPPGYPALQLSVPLAFDAVLAGRLPLARMVDATATRPAAILGLPRKGRIAPGYDADLILLDPDAAWVVDERALHSKVGWSPFHGRRLRGRIDRTYLRGRLVAAEGAVVGEPAGRLVQAPTRPPDPQVASTRQEDGSKVVPG